MVGGMSTEQLVIEVLRLPARDRALLAESLWASLEDQDDQETADDEAATLALARERDRQLDAGEVKPLSHAELMARLRQ